MKTNEVKILKDLITLLEKLVSGDESAQEENANAICSYCEKIHMKHKDLSDELEELLVSYMDLDHWGWDELPPSYTLEEIRDQELPLVRRMLKERLKVSD